MKRIILTLFILGTLGVTYARGFRVNGGVDIQPTSPSFGLTVTVERPSWDVFGVRWGPIATLNARTDFSDVDVQLLTGVGGAVVLPGATWSVKVKLLLNTELQTGEPFIIGPDIQVSFSTVF